MAHLNVINNLSIYKDVIFLPAERASLSVIPEQIMELVAYKNYFLKNYIENIRSIQSIVMQGLEAALHYLKPATMNDKFTSTVNLLSASIANILGGEYRKLDDGEFIVSGKTKTRISDASSGQQDIIWPLLLAFASIIQQKQVFFIIEEPEAHLYPETQARFLEVLALMAKAHPNNCIIITTHSPYIMEACNNLIQAGITGKKSQKKQPKSWQSHFGSILSRYGPICYARVKKLQT